MFNKKTKYNPKPNLKTIKSTVPYPRTFGNITTNRMKRTGRDEKSGTLLAADAL
jgi:hypothetical protein